MLIIAMLAGCSGAADITATTSQLAPVDTDTVEVVDTDTDTDAGTPPDTEDTGAVLASETGDTGLDCLDVPGFVAYTGEQQLIRNDPGLFVSGVLDGVGPICSVTCSEPWLVAGVTPGGQCGTSPGLALPHDVTGPLDLCIDVIDAGPGIHDGVCVVEGAGLSLSVAVRQL